MIRRFTHGKRWRLSDELWEQIEPLLPEPPLRDKFKGGRPMVPNRDAINGIFYVLKTGCQWKSLDATNICSGSVAHSRFLMWRKAGVFNAFWIRGLDQYDEAKGIDWRWLSMDGSMGKAPVAGSKKLVKTLRTEASKGINAAY